MYVYERGTEKIKRSAIKEVTMHFSFKLLSDESNGGQPQLMEGRADVGQLGLGPLLVSDSSVMTESGRSTVS